MPIYCPKCGAANEETAEFCASCGESIEKAQALRSKSAAQPAAQPTATQTTAGTEEKRLYRSRDDKAIAGVAAGLAKYLDMEVSTMRIIWVLLLIFTGGTAALAYLIMALVVPEEPA